MPFWAYFTVPAHRKYRNGENMKKFNEDMANFWLDQWYKVGRLMQSAMMNQDYTWYEIHACRQKQAWSRYEAYSSK